MSRRRRDDDEDDDDSSDAEDQEEHEDGQIMEVYEAEYAEWMEEVERCEEGFNHPDETERDRHFALHAALMERCPKFPFQVQTDEEVEAQTRELQAKLNRTASMINEWLEKHPVNTERN